MLSISLLVLFIYVMQKMKASMEIQLVKDHGTTTFECTNIEKTVIRSFQPENAIKYFPPMNSISLYTSQVQLRGEVLVFCDGSVFFLFTWIERRKCLG